MAHNNNSLSQMFTGAHDFSIGASIFQTIGRDLNIFSKGNPGQGIIFLQSNTCSSASYNAEARFPPPLCHPGTRKTILQYLERWSLGQNMLSLGHHGTGIADSHNNPRICWLYGGAGAGKSAIAQTLAESWAKNCTLAGSFFFWRADPLRNNPQQLFTIIALQLTVTFPKLRPIIDSVMLEDPGIPTYSIEIQFERLILKPWADTLALPGNYAEGGSDSGNISSRKRMLIIDGLDECSDSRNQQRIILSQAMKQYPLPFTHLLITSRPEPRIKEAFNNPKLDVMCYRLSLTSDYQVSQDIRNFVRDRCTEILERHSGTMEAITRPWPTFNQIEEIVQKSSNHFIYASTVLKYIDDDSTVPADRLNIVLGLSPLADDIDESPFTDLDALYRQILSTHKNTTLISRMLAAIVHCQNSDLSRNYHLSLKSDLIIDIIGSPKGTISAAFSGAHSLFVEPSPVESSFRFSHMSLTEFLRDPKRSMEFCSTHPSNHDFLAQRCIDIISNTQPESGWSIWPPDSTAYAYHYWAYHCLHASGSIDLRYKLQTFDLYGAFSTLPVLQIDIVFRNEAKLQGLVNFILQIFSSSTTFQGKTYFAYQYLIILMDSFTQENHGQIFNQLEEICLIGVCIRTQYHDCDALPIPLSSVYCADLKSHIERQATTLQIMAMGDCSVWDPDNIVSHGMHAEPLDKESRQ